MDHHKDILSRLASNKPSNWKANAWFRRENRHWLKYSTAIAQMVIVTMKNQNISQEALAVRSGLPPERIKHIIKGKENLTLEMISKLETALGIQIVKLVI